MIPVSIEIPSGRYTRGGCPDDKFVNATELPREEIEIVRPFRMSIYPITVGEWRASGLRSVEDFDDPNLPVTGVSYFEAEEYCRWLEEESGVPWRLPTEVEWEYACRAGTDAPFFTGSDISLSEANFLYAEDGSRVGPGHLLPVGSFQPNSFGLFDMHGNVSEWTSDVWRSSHETGVEDDPSRRAVRGGGWDYLPRMLRCSWRDALPPETKRDNLGFRVVVETLACR